MKPVCVLGDGSWGTAVATLLAHNGHTVYLWCHNPSVAAQIQQTRINTHFLPNIILHERIIATINLELAFAECDTIFEAIPVQFMRSVLEKTKCYNTKNHKWIALSKGIEQKTFLLPTQIITDVLDASTITATVAGPSFAYELARQHLTGFVIATQDKAFSQTINLMLSTSFIRTDITSDWIGTQTVSALKNVIALGMGILEGAEYGNNTKALFFTRGLNALATLVNTFGGEPKAVYGLAGVGDLTLTAFSMLSKNAQLGYKIGTGQKLDHLLKETQHIPESINTLHSLNTLMQKNNVQIPLFNALFNVVFNDMHVQDILQHID
jgi:glycerol-3-phosphate dehydrogenase (NAD(P)+)